MLAYSSNCNVYCSTKQCYCKLPLKMMDHIQLPCCNDSIHHVICMINKVSCPNCKKKFNKQILDYICNANQKMKKKQCKHRVKQYRRNTRQQQNRDHIQNTVTEIILFREEFIKPKFKKNLKMKN